MTLLVHVPSYNGREALILECDSRALEWIQESFEKMVRDTPERSAGFTIGHEGPIQSDQSMRIRIEKVAKSGPCRIIREGNQFTWRMSHDDIKRFAELAHGLQSSELPAHQYLETDDPTAPVLVLSKGEYDAETLISMGSR